MAQADAPPSKLRQQFERNIAHGIGAVHSDIERCNGALTDEVTIRALHLLGYAKKLPDLWPETRSVLLQLAPLMEKAGHRDQWRPFLEDGNRLAQSLNDFSAAAELTIQIGYLCQLQGDAEIAYGWFEEGLILATKSGNPPNSALMGLALNRLAFAAYLLHRPEEVIALVERAQSALEPGDPEHAHSLFILGTLSYDRQEFPQSIDYLNRALNLRLQQDDLRRIARCYRSLGVAYYLNKEFTQALHWTEKALDVFTQLDDIAEQAVALMNMGATYGELGQFGKALSHYQDAEPILKRLADRRHLAMLYNNIGYVFQQESEWPSAIDAYQHSVDLWRSVNDAEGLINVLDGLGKVYMYAGEINKGMQIYDEALGLIPDLQNERVKQRYRHSFGVQMEEAKKQSVKK